MFTDSGGETKEITELEWLFQTLWTKRQAPAKFSFSIPHTIFFKNDQPDTWYYPNGVEKNKTIIMQKNSYGISMSKLKNSFASEDLLPG